MQDQPSVRDDAYFVLTSFAHVVVTVLFGELLNLTNFPGIPILAFAVSSKAFALVAGEKERFFAHSRWAALPLALVSLVILALLPLADEVLGGVVLFLYITYPRVIKAREVAPLDVLFHGGRYAILFLLGYGSIVTISAAAYVALVTVFLFGVAGELLVGLRRDGRTRNSASRIGVRGTVRLVNLLAVVSIILGSIIFGLMVNIPIPVGSLSVPLPVVAGLLLAVFLTRPISHRRSGHAPVSVRRREVLVLVVLALLIFSVPVATRVQYAEAAPRADYTVSVGMRVLVAGEYPSDVQSIVFNYRSAGTFYYVMLHTDGVLELARFVNGTRQPYLAQARTSLSPFSLVHYEIRVSNGTASVYLDGSWVLSSQIQAPGGEAMVSSSVPNQTLWVVSVTQFQVS